jgi:site-specific recombinase XerD
MVESDKDVGRWINNLNSASTKRIYAEGLLKFAEYTQQSPKEIIQSFLSSKKQAEDALTDFIYSLKEKDITPKSVHNHLVAVKSWLRHNDIEIKRKINCGNIKTSPKTEDESVPSQEELNRILKYADLRGKTAISLISFSGLRPSSAISIRLKDIPDLSMVNNDIKFEKTPAQIKVRSQYSKNSKPYFTFMSSEGCEFLQEYLRYRAKLGETLTGESTLLSYSQKSKLHSFSRKGFSKLIKRTFERSGYTGRPYVLRSYFDTGILNSGIQFVYQQFFMGHSGSMESIYTVNKNLPQSQIEEMRQLFKDKVEPKLESISAKSRSEVDNLKAQIEQLKEELKQSNAKHEATDKEVLRFMTESKARAESKPVLEAMSPTTKEQIISELIAEAKKRIKEQQR